MMDDPTEEMINNTIDWITRYENKEFPECFVPCPPFYDICNVGAFHLYEDTEQGNKCLVCYRHFDFTDSIE